MPRSAKPRPPAVRSDGEVTGTPPGGQPNGRAPKGLPLAAAAGTGASPGYGGTGALQSAVQNTPLPPGGGPLTEHPAVTAMRSYKPNVTPLFAPTQNPTEPVTAGAPLDAGPTNPMAMPMPGMSNISVANILEQAAQASGSPTLRALANQANAVAGSPTP